MRVLSLFDGISCARVALARAELPVEVYYASEIDKNAIKVSLSHYEDTIQLGDVRTVHIPAGQIDLLIGGSPCIDLSIAKAGRQGLEGQHSSLFWEYVRILRETKPTWFILENVASMPKKDKAIITQELGVEPVLFNASLVSAQNRKRLFWTNIKFDLPEDRGVLLKHILQPDAEVDESMTVDGKSFIPTQSKTSGLMKIGHIGNADSQANRVYDPEGKSATLSANGGGMGAKTGLYYVGHLEGNIRKGLEGQEHLSRAHRQQNRVYGTEGKTPALNATETSGRIHVLLDNGGEAKTDQYAIGRVELRRLDEHGVRHDADPQYPITRRITARESEKSNTLTSMPEHNLVVYPPIDNPPRIRKLTPIECERLQGLPDDYTQGIPKTHRYRCLGNAFNVDVVAHILTHLPH